MKYQVGDIISYEEHYGQFCGRGIALIIKTRINIEKERYWILPLDTNKMFYNYLYKKEIIKKINE